METCPSLEHLIFHVNPLRLIRIEFLLDWGIKKIVPTALIVEQRSCSKSAKAHQWPGRLTSGQEDSPVARKNHPWPERLTRG